MRADLDGEGDDRAPPARLCRTAVDVTVGRRSKPGWTLVSAVAVQVARVAGPSTQGVGGDDATVDVHPILQG